MNIGIHTRSQGFCNATCDVMQAQHTTIDVRVQQEEQSQQHMSHLSAELAEEAADTALEVRRWKPFTARVCSAAACSRKSNAI